MLKNKHFWIGFLIAYFLVSFVPATGLTAILGRKKKG